MATLDKYVVDVSTTLAADVLTTTGLGKALILGDSAQADRTKSFFASEWTGTDPAAELTASQEAMITRIFSQPKYPASVKSGRIDVGDVDIKATLDACLAYDADWYYIVNENIDDATHADIADWVNLAANQPRIYVAQTIDTNVAAYLAITAAGEKRVVGVYHNDAAEWVAAGWMGFAGAGLNPDQGSASWVPRTLTGIAGLQTELAGSLLTTLRAADVNYYGLRAGQGCMMDGKLLDGLYIDAQISADWLAVRISDALHALLYKYGNANQSIPLSDAGFVIVASEVRAILNQGVQLQHIKDDYEVILPTMVVGEPNEITVQDKADRLLRFTINAGVQGSIHRIAIALNVTAV